MIGLMTPSVSAEQVPDWVKNTAGWWATDSISETEFIGAIEFLIKEEIMQIDASQSDANSQGVPEWVKNTAGWWATDSISEPEFIGAIEFLINVGIISVEEENRCVNDLLKYFNDKKKITDVCNEHELSINEELIPHDILMTFNSHGLTGEEFSEKKSNDVYRIIMVGGSTMVGAESQKETTIPAIMQKMFDEQNLDMEIEVINAGISGGSSLSEYELINDKLQNFEPNLIIMMDGWNDLSIDSSVMSYLLNWERACNLADKNNFELIITIQPIAGFGDKILTPQEKINALTGQDHNGYQLLQAKSTYDYIIKEVNQLGKNKKQMFGEGACETADLHRIFDDISGPIYWDQGHIMNAGNFILAEKFFDLSMKKIVPSHISDYKFTTIISKYNSIPMISYLLDKLDIGLETFSEPLKKKILDNKKGNYFELKEKFGIEGILVGKDLRNVNLKTIDFNGQDLTGANLSGHDLRNVDLSKTIIRGANLSNTNLEGKILSGMDLRGVNFANATLKNADLTNADFSKTIQLVSFDSDFNCDIFESFCLEFETKECSDAEPVWNLIKNFSCISQVIENESIRTNFKNADLTNVKFGVTGNSPMQTLYFVNFENATLNNIHIQGAHIHGCTFSNAKLNGIIANQMIIVDNDFKNIEMNNFDISESWFQNTSFDNAEMSNGTFDSITFIDTHFPGTNFEGTNFTNLNQIGDDAYDNTYNCKNNDICKP